MPKFRRIWHSGSIYGDGPRRPLDREQRARYRFLLSAHRRARRITPLGELVGTAVLKRLSIDGRCDPGQDAIADDVGCCARTVRRALATLKALGLLAWQRRIVRNGWRVLQTSNAYVLTLCHNPDVSTGGQKARGTLKKDSFSLQQARPMTDREMQINAARQLTLLGGAIPPAWGISPADIGY